MKTLHVPSLLVLLKLLAAPAANCSQNPPAVTLRFDPGVTYQTMEAWGIVLPCRLFDPWARSERKDAAAYDRTPDRSSCSDRFNRALAAEMVERGVNRFRLEVGPQVEFVNDNDDPNVINWKAFRFKWQDAMVVEQLLPMKRLVEARGEPAVLYVSYDLRSKLTPPWLLRPEEYAELALATLTHLKKKFDLEPRYWSVINEPGNNRPGNPRLYARLTAAAGRRIHKAGFKTKMSGPECVTPKQIDGYMRAMEAAPGALDHFAQITYHLYWDPNTVEHRHTIRDWARKLKVSAAQTEWMEQRDVNVARHVFLCLTEADAVTWERYGWDLDTDPRRETFRRRSTAWYLRQFSRYVRPGAVRVKMTSPEPALKPVAFLSPRKKPVMVLINEDARPRPVKIVNLPPGIYRVSCTAPGALGKDLPGARLGRGRALGIELPARSVLTITADPPAPGPRAKP